MLQGEIKICFTDVLLNTSYLFKNMCPSWSGYMSWATNMVILEESHISMLPIIDLHVTDPSALYWLLLFVAEQCKILDVDMP